jgi:hypothetical protein
MTPIYRNPKLALRMNLSAGVTVLAMIYGVFELWMAYRAGPDAGYGYLFGIFFIGGGIYGMRQLLSDHADSVIALDAEPEGKAVIALWRPFRPKRIDTRVERLTEWRPYARKTRSMVIPMVLADTPDYPRPLQFEADAGTTLTPEFRALAGEALTPAASSPP